MSKHTHRSARYRELLNTFSDSSRYELRDALAQVKQHANAKFDESVDIAVNLNIKKSESVRNIVVLPHNFGKQRQILVFAKGAQVRQAEEAGAHFAGGADLIEKIKGGWCDFDVAVATPEMMREVAVLGPILGRRGLMPNPKSGTVTMDIETAVKELASGRREFRADKGGTVHAAIGKVSMDIEQLVQNSVALLESVRAQRPDGHKGAFLNTVYVCSTMGIGLPVHVDVDKIGVE